MCKVSSTRYSHIKYLFTSLFVLSNTEREIYTFFDSNSNVFIYFLSLFCFYFILPRLKCRNWDIASSNIIRIGLLTISITIFILCLKRFIVSSLIAESIVRMKSLYLLLETIHFLYLILDIIFYL